MPTQLATNPAPPATTGNGVIERWHEYHAEAQVVSVELHSPVPRQFQEFGKVKIEHTRRNSLITQNVGPTNVDGLISFESGYTRVVGSRVEPYRDVFGLDHAGWATLATGAIDRYNVLDTLTVDRAVAQVSTSHAAVNGHLPKVSFIGSRFENLRIGGLEIGVELDLELCGTRPQEGGSYLQSEHFLGKAEGQYNDILKAPGVPEILRTHYERQIAYISRLRGGLVSPADGGHPRLTCSLVKKITAPPIPGLKVFGNQLFIPNFGSVALATLEVGVKMESGRFALVGNNSQESDNSHYFTLNMFEMKLGCPVGGTTKGPGSSSNGHTSP